MWGVAPFVFVTGDAQLLRAVVACLVFDLGRLALWVAFAFRCFGRAENASPGGGYLGVDPRFAGDIRLGAPEKGRPHGDRFAFGTSGRGKRGTEVFPGRGDPFVFWRAHVFGVQGKFVVER